MCVASRLWLSHVPGSVVVAGPITCVSNNLRDRHAGLLGHLRALPLRLSRNVVLVVRSTPFVDRALPSRGKHHAEQLHTDCTQTTADTQRRRVTGWVVTGTLLGILLGGTTI